MTGQPGQTGATGHISLIDSRPKLTSEHLLKRPTRSFTHASEQRASLQLNFYWCPIWLLQLLSRLFSLSHRWRDRRTVARVPSNWPSRLSHLSRHVLDWPISFTCARSRLQFTGIPGRRAPISDTADPLEYFNLFVTDDMMDNIVTETNRRGKLILRAFFARLPDGSPVLICYYSTTC